MKIIVNLEGINIIKQELWPNTDEGRKKIIKTTEIGNKKLLS